MTALHETEDAKQLVERVNLKGRAALHFGDVCGADAAKQAVETAVSQFGRLNIFVHAAGGAERSN